jgi:hypothetical protein
MLCKTDIALRGASSRYGHHRDNLFFFQKMDSLCVDPELGCTQDQASE